MSKPTHPHTAQTTTPAKTRHYVAVLSAALLRGSWADSVVGKDYKGRDMDWAELLRKWEKHGGNSESCMLHASFEADHFAQDGGDCAPAIWKCYGTGFEAECRSTVLCRLLIRTIIMELAVCAEVGALIVVETDNVARQGILYGMPRPSTQIEPWR